MKRFQILEWAGNLFGLAALFGVLAAVGLAVYGLWQFGFYWELLIQVGLVLIGSFCCLALADAVTLLLELYDRLAQLPATVPPAASRTASAYPAPPASPVPTAPPRPS